MIIVRREGLSSGGGGCVRACVRAEEAVGRPVSMPLQKIERCRMMSRFLARCMYFSSVKRLKQMPRRG